MLDTPAHLDTDKDQCKSLDEDFKDTKEDGDDHQMETKPQYLMRMCPGHQKRVDEAYV